MDAKQMKLLPENHTADILGGRCLKQGFKGPFPSDTELVVLVSSINDIRGNKARARAPKPNVATWQGWQYQEEEIWQSILDSKVQAEAGNAHFLLVLVGNWDLYSGGFRDGLLPDREDLDERQEAADRHDSFYAELVQICT